MARSLIALLCALIPIISGASPRVHDPSTIIKSGSNYYVYYTGRGVPSWTSTDLVTWHPGQRVFDTPPQWTVPITNGTNVNYGRPGGYFWAPDIIHVGARYYLYYAASRFGKKTSAIGLAINNTLDPASPGYKWTDAGPVIETGDQDNFNAIDPSVFQDTDGSLWLALGSFWTGIKLMELDPGTGLRKAAAQIKSIASAPEIEASCLIQHEGRYFLFVDWGLCCKGLNSTYNMRVGRAEKITGPYLDHDGKDLFKGGGTLFLGNDGPQIGPGHAGLLRDAGKEYISYHFYDGNNNGTSSLGLRTLQWTADGWPAAGPIIAVSGSGNSFGYFR